MLARNNSLNQHWNLPPDPFATIIIITVIYVTSFIMLNIQAIYKHVPWFLRGICSQWGLNLSGVREVNNSIPSEGAVVLMTMRLCCQSSTSGWGSHSSYEFWILEGWVAGARVAGDVVVCGFCSCIDCFCIKMWWGGEIRNHNTVKTEFWWVYPFGLYPNVSNEWCF